MDNHRKEDAGHEVSGVNVRALGIFLTGFIFILGGLLVTLWVVDGVAGGWAAHERGNHELAINKDASSPLEQPLQPSPGHASLDWQDMAAARRSQDVQLHVYAQIPGDPQHVKIPIERAMQIVMQEKHSIVSSETQPASTTQPYINTTQPAATENRT